jgi:hypothetical protein
MPPDTATTTAAANSAANTTAPGAGGGGDVFPGGWELLSGALTGLLESFADGVAALVDLFHYHLLTLPAAGEPTAPATWGTFDDPYWIAVATVYGMLTAFVLPLVWGVGWFNVGFARGVARRERVKDVAKAVGLIVGGWPLLMFWLHFWNEAALAVAPSGAEFLSTPGDATKLGVGVALGIALLAYNALIVLAGLFLHLLFVLLTFVFVALWPVSVGLYLSDVFVVETMGNAGITGTLLLSPLQFAKAVLLRLIFEFPLEVSEPETAVSFILIAVGVTLAFVGIPYFGLKRLLPRSIVATGGRLGTRRRRRDRMDQLQQRVPSGADLKARVEEVSSGVGSRLSRRGGSDGGSALQARSRSGGSSGSGQTRGEDTRTRTRTLKQRFDEAQNDY